MRGVIEQTWDGCDAESPAHVAFELRAVANGLEVVWDAPFYGDPRPGGPPGSFEGLWHFEVFELFLLGQGARYLEAEFGPHGHHLLLELDGVRSPKRRGLPVRYEAHMAQDRWTGRAVIARRFLPPGLGRFNAYAIHGAGPLRRYLAYCPPRGVKPDFHRLECFAPLEPSLLLELAPG